MRVWAAILLLTSAALLAGCSGGNPPPVCAANCEEPPVVGADKGAITGLVFDDRFRPIPDASVLLTPAGLTATTGSEGQFSFGDLAPGGYIVLIQIADHEAAPTNADVLANEYTELEIEARRVFSDSGSIITTEYSVFIPCAAAFVANSVTANCLGDLSGDSYRSGFTTKKFNKTLDVTVMVTEMLANQKGTYSVQVREDNGDPSGGERYAVGRIVNDRYIKMVNVIGAINQVDNLQRNNVNFTGAKPFDTTTFLEGEYAAESQGLADTICQPSVSQTCRGTTGAGAVFALKAKFVQTLFIGQPEQDVQAYAVLKPA